MVDEKQLKGEIQKQQHISYEDYEPRCETESEHDSELHNHRANDLLLPTTPTKKTSKFLSSNCAVVVSHHAVSTHGVPSLMQTMKNGK